MSELGPEARSLLDLARRASVPTPEEADRLWSRVRDAATAPAAPSGAPSGLGGSAPIFAAAAAITAAIVAAALFATHAPKEPATSAPPQVEIAAPPAAPREAPAPPAPVAPDPAPLVAPATSAPAPRAKPAARAAPPADDEHGDVAMVRAAYEALRAGDAARSLGLLDEHARKFPSSALAEEREATRVLALCALGRRADARAALDRYRRAYPAAMQLHRVPKACLDDEGAR